MNRSTDPVYLRDDQYKTPSNLAARATLHERFSTAPGSWQQWVMDQIALRPGDRVLEVGGGPGWLWRENRDRLPSGLSVCFSDFSYGMVRAARTALIGTSGFGFTNCDVQHLPLRTGAFDVAIANYMLQHVPDLPRAVRELRRVLAPGGRLCAATFGAGHLRELDTLLHTFEPGWSGPEHVAPALRPRLENAAEWLGPAFSRIEVLPRADSLSVTEARPLVDYAYSMSSAAGLAADRAGELEEFFHARIQANGGIRIAKAGGIVSAWAD
jgi:SAM-dependent methyltransferase